MNLLKELTAINAPSGRESGICEYIKNIACEYADEVSTDTMGNLIIHQKGDGKRIMAMAHMDEIGVIVTYIEENGFIRFAPVGGLNTDELNHRAVVFENGCVGVISLEEKEKKADVLKMYIDVGANSAADVSVNIGDCAAFVGGYNELGNRIVSKALDNRAGCFVLLEAMKKTKNSNNDLYYVFSVQEEVGLRGASTSAFGIMPDLAICVDTTLTGDTPECKPNNVSLGKGVTVKVMDASVLCHSEVRCALIECAKKANIPYQLEVLTAGGTDAGRIHMVGSGIKTGGISIPTRYIHSPAEMIDKDDLDACVKLLIEYLNN